MLIITSQSWRNKHLLQMQFRNVLTIWQMTSLTLLLLLSGILGVMSGWWMYKKTRLRRILSLCLWSLSILCLCSGSYSYWYHHRPLPAPIVRKQLFEGVTYSREIFMSPRPNVVHIVTIDVATPGIRFLVTPSTLTDGKLPAKTTSRFLQESGVQVAINGSFFSPFRDKFFQYYPHDGDPVSVYGFTMSQGQQYSTPESGYNPLLISRTNQLAVASPLGQVYNALSGYDIFVKEGKVQKVIDQRYHPNEPSPRTAIAIDQPGQRMILLVVDGRQPNYSEGMTLAELGEIGIDYGAYTALNLDGGGSSTLVVEDPPGKAVVLNSPIHRRIPPGRQRPVANHLGIFANRT